MSRQRKGCGVMQNMIEEYRQALAALYRRREELCNAMGAFGKRLAVLDEEIDELEEAVMHIRRYAAVYQKAV